MAYENLTSTSDLHSSGHHHHHHRSAILISFLLCMYFVLILLRMANALCIIMRKGFIIISMYCTCTSYVTSSGGPTRLSCRSLHILMRIERLRCVRYVRLPAETADAQRQKDQELTDDLSKWRHGLQSLSLSWLFQHRRIVGAATQVIHPRLNHSRELVFLVFQAKRISKLEGAFGAACGCGLQVTVLCVVGSGHRTIILSPLQSPDMVFGLVRSMMSMIPRIVQSRTFHYRSVADFRVWWIEIIQSSQPCSKLRLSPAWILALLSIYGLRSLRPHSCTSDLS